MTEEIATNARARSVLEWFTRREALTEARSDPRVLDVVQRGLFARAHGALKAAERVAPVHETTVPYEEVGDDATRALLALSMLSDAAAWALAAAHPEQPISVAQAWSAADSAELAKAAGGDEELARVRRVLHEDDAVVRSTRPGAELTADLQLARRFVNALVDRLERRANRVARVVLERWMRVGGALAALTAALFLANAAIEARRPDLVPNAHWTASSNEGGWSATGVGTNGPHGSANVFFHTQPESNPWLEFDLGSMKTISRVLIENRTDCCQERAVPLILETSNDRRTWTEAARQTDQFTTWEKKFRPALHGRYVRARVPRLSALHLAQFEIH